MKKKMSLTGKLLITMILTFLSMLVMVVKINPWMTTTIDEQGVIQTLTNYYVYDFSLINLLIGFFIFYFYYIVYYDGNKYTKKNFFMSIISIILTIVVFLGEVYKSSEQILSIIISPAYAIVCIMFCIGMYFIIYAILKKIYLIINGSKKELLRNVSLKKKQKINL